MHGWPQWAETVAKVFHSLSTDDQAIAAFSDRITDRPVPSTCSVLDLAYPGAISSHNRYWIWDPRECRGDVLLVIGDNREQHEALFTTVELGATHTCQDCKGFEREGTETVQ